tara:strand:+ start:414 stop:602 length:189 start_codon:yes stop_codon:yes gene_type:complete
MRDRASHQRNLPKAQHSKAVFWPLRLCPDKLAVIPLFRLSNVAAAVSAVAKQRGTPAGANQR